MVLPCNMDDWGDRFVDKEVEGLLKILWEVLVWEFVVMGLWRGVRWYSGFSPRVVYTT